MDATGGDYHLQKDSPCIDVGTGTGAPITDFEADLRPIDGDLDDSAVVDIGADESNGIFRDETVRVVYVSKQGDDDFDGSSLLLTA